MSPIQLARQKAREMGIPLYSPQGVDMALRLLDSLRGDAPPDRPDLGHSRAISVPTA